MTPEKIAWKIVEETLWPLNLYEPGELNPCVEAIVTALREAIEEERKGCLKALNSLLAQCEGNETGIGCLMAACRELEARRERQKKRKAA